jgi:hypothetical protein
LGTLKLKVKLHNDMSTKKNCFIISPIGEEASEVRKRADQVLKHILTPAAQACGYEPIRADKISEPGMITSQIIQHIVDDPLVIADLTGMNPNVFYELAIRHAIRKPLVQIVNKGEKIPFDVAGMRTIPVDHHDLDSVEEAKEEIQKQIKVVEGKKPDQIESPISVSMEIQTLRQSDRPEDRTLAELVSALSQMRADVASLDKRLSAPEKLIPPAYLRDVLRSFGGQFDKRTIMLTHELRHMMRTLYQMSEGKDSKATREDKLELMKRADMLMFEMEKGFDRERGAEIF